ncbi:MAG: hypothetical protein IIZ67_03990 [Bacilli bacterium]|nr:hypothetical protein [Bacilli bacterium]
MNKNKYKDEFNHLLEDLVTKHKITYTEYYLIKDYVKLLETIITNDNKVIINLSKEKK